MSSIKHDRYRSFAAKDLNCRSQTKLGNFFNATTMAHSSFSAEKRAWSAFDKVVEKKTIGSSKNIFLFTSKAV